MIRTALRVGELMTPNDHCPGVWPVWTLGAQVAGFKKRIIEHCYSQNIKAPGLMVSENKIFVCFSYFSRLGSYVPWCGVI